MPLGVSPWKTVAPNHRAPAGGGRFIRRRRPPEKAARRTKTFVDDDEDDLRCYTVSARPQGGAIIASGAYAKHVRSRHGCNSQEVSEGDVWGKVMPRRGSATLAHGVSRGERYTRKRQATEWRQKDLQSSRPYSVHVMFRLSRTTSMSRMLILPSSVRSYRQLSPVTTSWPK